MFTSKKLLIALAICYILLLQLTLEIEAGCVCNEKGTDYCESCSGTSIVRPKPKYYGGGDLDLPPIGDNCWCSKLSIEPARVPKPPCPKHKTSCTCSTSYDSAPAPYSYDSPAPPPSPYSPAPLPYIPPSSYNPPSYSYAMPEAGYAPAPKPKDDSLPADPISVSLAVQADKAIAVPEAKLAYGFVQKPLDGLKKVYLSNVPEENLFKLQKEVITLKKRAEKPKEEEELPEEEEEEESAADDDDDRPHLTYKQLGYEPEKFKNPKFREVSSAYAYTAPSSGYTDSDDYYKPSYRKSKASYDCGFKPGRISPYRKISSKPDLDCYESL